MNQQLFGENDVFQAYGIPMNPTDTTTMPVMPGMEDRQRQQNQDGSSNAANNSITGSELISYQQPIDFTDFLNIDDNDVLSPSGSFVKDK